MDIDYAIDATFLVFSDPELSPMFHADIEFDWSTGDVPNGDAENQLTIMH